MMTAVDKAAWIAGREAKHRKIKDRIKAAGIQYPASWDEMGSSEKDMWEDRAIRGIEYAERLRK